MNELASWLLSLRQEAKIGLPALAEKTKIAIKHLEALERGEREALPSQVHARAFALAYARACGADDDEAVVRVQAAFAPRNVSVPDEAKVAGFEGELATPVGLSSRDRLSAMPWRLWAWVGAGAVLLLLLLNAAVSCIRSLPTVAPLSHVQPAAVTSTAEVIAPAPDSATPEVVGEALDLRSRRPCWVVLEIDGKRLPTIFLERDKKERWTVTQKAVMLAGNIGAVRVWWRGDNLGYFGALGERMNGIVFEVGQPWKEDPKADLALPPGVPAQAPPVAP